MIFYKTSSYVLNLECNFSVSFEFPCPCFPQNTQKIICCADIYSEYILVHTECRPLVPYFVAFLKCNICYRG